MIALPTLAQMTTRSDATLREAMLLIDANALGACFAVEGSVLVGVLSDGDIRRALLGGAHLDAPVSDIMTRSYVWLPSNSSLQQIQARLTEEIRLIPILDLTGNLVDYACPARYHHIPLAQPILDGSELEYVTDCIRNGWISSQGKYVNQFEQAFGHYVSCPNTLAVSNGTVALHLALLTLGIGAGDEVLVPDLTFAATVNAVLHAGATPVFIDIDPRTMALNVAECEQAVTARTRAVIPVHLYGHPADMDQLMWFCAKHGLTVIEDCAEAIGSFYRSTHVGNYGTAATFSFYGNKTITTGEGGMLLFKDRSLLERARILRDHGMSRERRYWHEHVGYNYRLTNIQAAIGVAQMERVAEFVARKRWIAKQYQQRLQGIKGLRLPCELGEVQNSYWLYTIVLTEEMAGQRSKVLEFMSMTGIEARPVFIPLHRMPPYTKYVELGKVFPNSDAVSDGGISLPTAPNLMESEIELVCSALVKALASTSVGIGLSKQTFDLERQ